MAAARCTCPVSRSLVPRASFCRAPACALAAALACSCLLLAATPPLAQQPADVQAKVPVADFFRTPRLDRPALSPSGRYLAGAVSVDGGRVQLAVFDVENPGQSKVVAGFLDADVNEPLVGERRAHRVQRHRSRFRHDLQADCAGIVGRQPRRQRIPSADQRRAESLARRSRARVPLPIASCLRNGGCIACSGTARTTCWCSACP